VDTLNCFESPSLPFEFHLGYSGGLAGMFGWAMAMPVSITEIISMLQKYHSSSNAHKSDVTPALLLLATV
jgi:hypothetical protein